MLRQKQISNLFVAAVADLASITTLAANELVYVSETNSWYKVAATGGAAADGEHVLSTGSSGLSAFYVAGLGESGLLVAAELTVAALGDAADFTDKLALLTAEDGSNKAGLYLSDGTDWVYVDVDSSRHTKAGAPDANDDTMANYKLGDTLVDTTSSPLQAYVCVNASAGAAVWRRITDLEAPVIFQGTHDASSGDFPGGAGVSKGFMWVISTGGTVDGLALDAGDSIYALVDDPAIDDADDWARVEGVVPAAGKLTAVGTTVAGFPSPASSAGMAALLTQGDGSNMPGLYVPAGGGTVWTRVDTDLAHHRVKAGAPSTSNDWMNGYLLAGVIVDTAGKDAYITVDDATGAAKHLKLAGERTVETVSVTGVNTLAALAVAPKAGTLELFVNGLRATNFTVSGTAITWVATGAYALATTDEVVAKYVPAL